MNTHIEALEHTTERFFVRHSLSGYNSYLQTCRNENPLQKHNFATQTFPDVPEDENKPGRTLAKTSAGKLLDTFDKENDVLVVFSSQDARALETAALYVNEALETGYNVLEHTTGSYGSGAKSMPHMDTVNAQEGLDAKYVRPLQTLSWDMKHVLPEMVFNTVGKQGYFTTQLETLPKEEQDKWEQAQAIIVADDRGSWGENYHVHSEAVSEIYPGVKTADTRFEKDFAKLYEISDIVETGVKANNPGKDIKILYFGHEGTISKALEKHTGDQDIKNCEPIKLVPGIPNKVARYEV